MMRKQESVPGQSDIFFPKREAFKLNKEKYKNLSWFNPFAYL